eukprot:453978-Amphidinium_carterae.1
MELQDQVQTIFCMPFRKLPDGSAEAFKHTVSALPVLTFSAAFYVALKQDRCDHCDNQPGDQTTGVGSFHSVMTMFKPDFCNHTNSVSVRKCHYMQRTSNA